MKTLLTISSMMMMSVLYFEGQLNIVPRYHAGTIQADVARIQTYTLSDGTTHVITRGVDPVRYNANMKAIRAHVLCVEDAPNCGNPSKRDSI